MGECGNAGESPMRKYIGIVFFLLFQAGKSQVVNAEKDVSEYYNLLKTKDTSGLKAHFLDSKSAVRIFQKFNTDKTDDTTGLIKELVSGNKELLAFFKYDFKERNFYDIEYPPLDSFSIYFTTDNESGVLITEAEIQTKDDDGVFLELPIVHFEDKWFIMELPDLPTLPYISSEKALRADSLFRKTITSSIKSGKFKK